MTEPSKFPVGVVVWLAVMIAAGVGLWLLSNAFPGQLSDQENQIHLVRSGLIVTLIASGLIGVRNFSARKIVRDIALWLAIGAVLILGYAYQDTFKALGARIMAELVPSEPVVMADNALSLTRGDDGHFHVGGWADNTRIRFMIDTGASDISISPADARRIGIDLAALDYTTPYQTANGLTYGARYRLQVLSIGPFEFRDVVVSINKAEMNQSLLGMSFLNRLSGFEISGRQLILRR